MYCWQYLTFMINIIQVFTYKDYPNFYRTSSTFRASVIAQYRFSPHRMKWSDITFKGGAVSPVHNRNAKNVAMRQIN